jgi:hypothetical protein
MNVEEGDLSSHCNPDHETIVTIGNGEVSSFGGANIYAREAKQTV